MFSFIHQTSGINDKRWRLARLELKTGAPGPANTLSDPRLFFIYGYDGAQWETNGMKASIRHVPDPVQNAPVNGDIHPDVLKHLEQSLISFTEVNQKNLVDIVRETSSGGTGSDYDIITEPGGAASLSDVVDNSNWGNLFRSGMTGEAMAMLDACNGTLSRSDLFRCVITGIGQAEIPRVEHELQRAETDPSRPWTFALLKAKRDVLDILLCDSSPSGPQSRNIDPIKVSERYGEARVNVILHQELRTWECVTRGAADDEDFMMIQLEATSGSDASQKVSGILGGNLRRVIELRCPLTREVHDVDTGLTRVS